MSEHRGRLVLLPPNRVRRLYAGGRTLDAIAGAADPRDSDRPEDWIASVTESSLAPDGARPDGASTVLVGGRPADFRTLLEEDPGYFLGPDHVRRFGAHPMLLVKLLDASRRFFFQVHPSQAFAREHLGTASGKTEAYHILGVRPGSGQPFLYIGFQHPPQPAELRRMVEQQDIAALERCFEKIPVAPGYTYLVPGGVPHAIGGEILLVEIQEPTDFVVRYEFSSADRAAPEATRFMGRGVDFALAMTDFSARPRDRIERDHRRRPRNPTEIGPGSWREELIGPEQTPCFRVRRAVLGGSTTLPGDGPRICIVTSGSLVAEAGGEAHALKTYDKFFVPAGLGPLRLTPGPRAEILECLPPLPGP